MAVWHRAEIAMDKDRIEGIGNKNAVGGAKDMARDVAGT